MSNEAEYNDSKVEKKCDNNHEECDDDCQYIFPQRLMSILSEERNSDAICWLPHGRAFIIRNRKVFAEKVMPRFFPRKSKYSSFTRKLNRWNFVRVSSGPELGAYYHEFFLRDKPHLAAQMFCKNARTKIAMASDAKVPPPTANCVPEQHSQAVQQPSFGNGPVDSAQLHYNMMGGQQQSLDPTMQMLLEQQLALCRSQQQQQQQQMAAVANNPNNQGAMFGAGNMNLLQNAPLAVQQQILAEKQHQARMIQLRQLMALNLQRQQTPGKRKSNNPRASAA